MQDSLIKFYILLAICLQFMKTESNLICLHLKFLTKGSGKKDENLKTNLRCGVNLDISSRFLQNMAYRVIRDIKIMTIYGLKFVRKP